MASSSTLNAEPAAVDPGFQEVLGCGKRPKNTERMNALVQAEGEDIDNPSRRPRRSRRAPKKQNAAVDPNNFFSSLPVEEASNADDGDFTGSESSSQSSSSGSETNTTEILNVELADVLPMKTVPPRGGNSDPNAHQLRKKANAKSKRKAAGNASAANGLHLSKRARVEDAEDDGDILLPSSSQVPQVDVWLKHPKLRGPTNPIYLFYEEVLKNAQCVEGTKGDKHYKCYHGQRKILTITKAMRSSLNGLIGHIKTHFPVMYRLYLYLKDRAEPPTEDEVAMASGKKILDPTQAAEYLLQLEKPRAILSRLSTTRISELLKPTGIRICLSSFSLNGWSHVTSHLKKLTGSSFVVFSSILTYDNRFTSLIVKL
ncbi:hypothetical protein BDR03DRAFT_1019113 [Suillus americanus]|nr:hypothetical protein BDR03DRAFT_1019113 [Suillus americanus]